MAYYTRGINPSHADVVKRMNADSGGKRHMIGGHGNPYHDGKGKFTEASNAKAISGPTKAAGKLKADAADHQGLAGGKSMKTFPIPRVPFREGR